MKQILIAVYDEKAKAYLSLHPSVHRSAALRSFGDAVQDPQTSLSKHPSDYKLYALGEFDDNTGEVKPFATNEYLGVGSDFVKTDLKIKKD